MRTLNATMENATVALSSTSLPQTLEYISVYDITASVTAANPSNKTFVDANVSVANDTITIVNHGFTTGMLFTLTTTGTLPGGLALSTNYYAIVVDASTIKVASSQANAAAGTAIDITSASGGGTHTVNVTTAISGSIKLQKTNDDPKKSDAVWLDITGTTQNFSSATNINYTTAFIGFRAIRSVTTVTSGTIRMRVQINGKGRI
jgi:hypothetical protein